MQGLPSDWIATPKQQRPGRCHPRSRASLPFRSPGLDEVLEFTDIRFDLHFIDLQGSPGFFRERFLRPAGRSRSF
jgi:hypothetical protein